MVGVEDAGFHGPDRLDGLVDGHRIGLVDGQERDVDVAQGLHFGSRLRVAGDVDAQAADGQQITAVLAHLGVELEVSVGGVVGGYGFDLDVVARRGDASGAHDVALHVETLGHGAVAEDVGLRGRETFDRRPVEVVVVRVGYEDQVGLGLGRIVGQRTDGVDVDAPARARIDGQRRMLEKGDGHLAAVARGERIGGVGGRLRAAATEKREQGHNDR